ncbi:snRNA-activating protein complex subunit 4 [Cottoperca gobio]|uniref:snRNA-activating protein complex subunit 4 n=1 Tax=Cottoperca gobio TaxID=56716 RepID=A0A6J2PFL7_COTGO|nr:snRNA-activating protein complex subunit 4 [Cottoperca gobio]
MRIGNFIPYTQMSYFMEGRDPAQLIYRWNQVLDPSLKKGFWTGEEDELLLQAVSRHGEKDWWKIRLEVPGRTDSGCRDRYYDCLKAETKKGPFDQQEKGLLLVLVQKHGVGRWARIAAEIPHRNDAQCLREWRKLNKPAAPPRDKKDRKPPRSRGGGAKTQTKEDAPAKKRIRRPLTKVKEEVEEVVQVESSEDETMVVEYMDSDEEEKKEKRQEIVEEVEEYTLSPMQEWIPVEKAQCSSFPAFRPVELPSSGAAHSQVSVRSTILGPFGLSVIFGPQPRELPREERHSSSMMMVSADQLQAHLHRQASKFNCPSSGPRRKVHTEKQNPLGRGMDMGLSYELQAAVTPWIGNLLILQKHRLTTADALRQRREKTRLPSTPVFLLLLQTLNVDATGCKDMIEQRRNRVVSLVPPPPCPPSVRTNTVAGMLQQRKLIKEEQEFDLQQKWILKQLQALQQRPQQLMLVQQLMLLQQPPSSPRPPATPSQNCPGVLLQMPLNMSPQMFPQAVIIPHPVTQPRAASMQLMPPFSLNTLPPAVGAVASPLPAHPAPQRLSVPPVSVVPLPLNAASTCSDSPPQEAVPLPPHQHLSAGCTLPGQHTAPSSSPVTNPRRARPASSPSRSISRSPKGKGQQAACSSVIKERQRSRRPSQKAKALQEAKAEAKKKEASSRLKRAPIQSPVPSATQNLSLAPAHSITTNQHTALPANFHNDHDYTSLNLHPGQRGSIKPTPLPSKKPPKAPSSGRKRGSGGQPSMTSSQGDQCVGGTGTGVIQKEKRVRNLTQRARALQEDTQAKAEAKKKRTPSPPRKKCSRTSRPKEEVVTQNRPVAPPPSGFCLQPGQSMWVMTPGGLVQLAQALPHSLQLPLVPSGPLPAPPTTAPLRLTTGGPRSIAPQPSSAFSVSLRKEALQFDPSLMFLESQEAVRDWLSGRGGVAVPGAGTALPYLPPFVSSLSALSALLRAKKSLTKTSLQLLSRGSEPRRPTTKLDGTERTPMLPDSTSDLRAARDAAAPSVSSNVLQAEEEAELVAVARQLVTERFSGNPAYQLLKARFLSCFTVPALLATVQPIGEKTVAGQADEEEEEEEVKKIKERGRQRRVERSLLLCDGPGAPANHFSGICTNTAGPDQ